VRSLPEPHDATSYYMLLVITIFLTASNSCKFHYTNTTLPSPVGGRLGRVSVKPTNAFHVRIFSFTRDVASVGRPSVAVVADCCAGIPVWGNLSLDWELQQRLGKSLGK